MVDLNLTAEEQNLVIVEDDNQAVANEERTTSHESQNGRNLRAQVSEEEFAKYREQRRQNERKRKAQMTEEQLAERRIRRRNNEKRRLAQMTEEQLAKRREKRSLLARQRRQRIKQIRLHTSSDRHQNGRQSSEIITTEEEKAAERKARRRQYQRNLIARMTEEQLAKYRERRCQQAKQRRQRNRERRLQIVIAPRVSEMIAKEDQVADATSILQNLFTRSEQYLLKEKFLHLEFICYINGLFAKFLLSREIISSSILFFFFFSFFEITDQTVNNQVSDDSRNQHLQMTEGQSTGSGEQVTQDQQTKTSDEERRARRRQLEKNRLARMTEEQLAARRERRRQQTQLRRQLAREKCHQKRVAETTVASEDT